MEAMAEAQMPGTPLAKTYGYEPCHKCVSLSRKPGSKAVAVGQPKTGSEQPKRDRANRTERFSTLHPPDLAAAHPIDCL
jgi:hypothetical protein